MAGALLAFVFGATVGARSGGGGGDEASQQAISDSRQVNAKPIARDVPTVSDFHDAVPILMYHAISPAPPGAQLPALFVPEGEFEAQMKWLRDADFNGVTLGQVFAAWNEGEPIARNPVVISFDDGLQSQYVGARPMLDRLGWPGVLNLELDHLDSGDLSRDQVHELIDAGWEIDSHTYSHPDLTADGVELDREVAYSRRYLQEKFGIPVDFFCYPAGDYDDEVIAAVEAAGYAGATTTVEGLAEPDAPYELSRIRVEPGDGAEGLKAKLAAADV